MRDPAPASAGNSVARRGGLYRRCRRLRRGRRCGRLLALRRLRRQLLRNRHSVHELPLHIAFLALEVFVARAEVASMEPSVLPTAVDADDPPIRRAHHPPFLRAGHRIHIETTQIALHRRIALVLQQVFERLRETLVASWGALVVNSDGAPNLVTDEKKFFLLFALCLLMKHDAGGGEADAHDCNEEQQPDVGKAMAGAWGSV